MLFKDLTEKDIEDVETTVRQRLLLNLKSKKQFDVSESNMIKYFGDIYYSSPDHFKFQLGDRKIIRLMQSHIKEAFSSGCYFISSESKLKKEASSKNEQQMSADAQRTYFFLNKMQAATDRNAKRKIGGYRYDSDIKLFAAYLRMLVGKLGYETIQKNMPCALPSLSSTNRYIQASNCKPFEGVLRAEELLLHLKSRNLPLTVSLSEDATRIMGKVQYDSTTNQLIGFALPINETNGMPIPYAFPARNAEDFLSHFSGHNSSSNHLNIIMAQPLANVAPFCLLIYGSDNKYTSNNVVNRWINVVKELKRLNINVLTISSDSDPRYNSAMRYLSKLGSSENFMELHLFKCAYIENHWLFFVQDIIHIATKLRNFLLRTLQEKRIIPFGNQNITIKHLFSLLVKFPKDAHQLTASVLNPNDRQNFESVRRMIDTKVIHLLKTEIENSDATVLFLELVRDIIDSYMDPMLLPLERVQKIWYAIFVFRIWREFISKNKKYTLQENCLTTNCYSCIELNGRSLVQIMLYLKENAMEELFVPSLFSSQQCESTFRQLRSLTSAYSTVTNCTVKEALSRINKIQFQNEIIHLTSPNFFFPRQANQNDATNIHKLPSQKEICDVILKCKSEAINTALKFNLLSSKTNSTKATSCQIKQCVLKQNKRNNITPNEKHSIKNLTISDFKNIALKNYAEQKIDTIIETSPFIEFVFGSKRIVIKKTSFCWLLREDVRKLSNDRLLRVQANNAPKKKNGVLHISKNSGVKKKRIQINIRHKFKY